MNLELHNEVYRIIMYASFEKKFTVKNISPTLLLVIIIVDRVVFLIYRLKQNKTKPKSQKV